MPKSISSLLVLLAVIFTLSGCANNDQKQNQSNQNQNEQAQTSTSTTPTSTQATTSKEDLPVWPKKEFSEEDYEGWKTYTHEELGYQIKYPSNWTVNDCDNERDSDGCGLLKGITIKPPDAEKFTAYISISKVRRSLDDIRKSYLDTNNWEGEIYKEKKVLFDNKESYYYFDGPFPDDIGIVVPYNNKIYDIDSQKINNPKVIQSLASFKFIR